MKSLRYRIPLIIALFGLISTATFASDDDDELEFEARLTGAAEVPPVETRTKGKAEFEVNDDWSMIKYKLRVRTKNDVGLLGAAGAHIHCGPVDDTGPVVAFLIAVVEGGFDGRIEIKSRLTDADIRSTACGDTVAEVVDAMLDGMTYVNVHSLDNRGGEVRGQIRLDD